MKRFKGVLGLGMPAFAGLVALACVRCGGENFSTGSATGGSGGSADAAAAAGDDTAGGVPPAASGGTGGSTPQGGSASGGRAEGGSAVVGGGGGGDVAEAGAGGEPSLPVTGEHHGFVVAQLAMPTNENQAETMGFDLNGDDAVDNRFGRAMAAFATQGLAINATIAEGIQKGDTILLANLQAMSLSGAENAGFSTFFGKDPLPAPCLASNDCGQHLLGTGRFGIAPTPPGAACQGSVQSGTFTCQGGDLPIILVLAGTPLELTLHHARVELAELNDAGFGWSKLGGAISEEDVNERLFPAELAVITNVLAAECAGLPPTCGCTAGVGSYYLGLLDANDDCSVTLEEIKANPTTGGLFKPDLDLDGDDELESLSCGLNIRASRATFEVP